MQAERRGDVGMTEFIVTCQSELQKDGSYKIERYRELVRCKDCKKMETMYCPFYWRYKGTKYDDWFCADGERSTK